LSLVHNVVMADDLDRLEGPSSSVRLDHQAQTLVFEHGGSVATDEQKAASPVAVPLGAIASVECRPGRSTNWFWVVRRGHTPWRKGVWTDPCGVVSTTDPTAFAERVRSALATATPTQDDAPSEADVAARQGSGWRGRLAKGVGRAVVDGFFNTR
jgi:hypothetical protein